ncbi:hypothetical protein BDV97DRAFT_42701 [Delphinella strobiligena]|nr:hypothetical protein BDV97DRAFT_42701 [Delphinella strobiligena]
MTDFNYNPADYTKYQQQYPYQASHGPQEGYQQPSSQQGNYQNGGHNHDLHSYQQQQYPITTSDAYQHSPQPGYENPNSNQLAPYDPQSQTSYSNGHTPPPPDYSQYIPEYHQQYQPQTQHPQQQGHSAQEYYGDSRGAGANVPYTGSQPSAQYSGQAGYGQEGAVPGQEGDRGLGATLLGGAGGAFLGHKTAGGGLGTLGGMVLGAIGANVLENKHEKDKKEKKHKKHRSDSHGHGNSHGSSHGSSHGGSHGHHSSSRHDHLKHHSRGISGSSSSDSD